MGRSRVILTSNSPEETFAIGQQLGKSLPPASVVGFFGDLAAGKTTLIKGLASQAAETSPDQVSSPTFVLLNIYEGPKPIYHFDLYRLQNAEEFLNLGFEEFWHLPGICCIEWAERIENILPANCIKISMHAIGEMARTIEIDQGKL